jgi:hypothetical protein
VKYTRWNSCTSAKSCVGEKADTNEKKCVNEKEHTRKKFILSYDGETDAVVVIERRSSSITVLVHDAAGFT